MTKTLDASRSIGCGIGRSHIAEGYAPHARQVRVQAICDLNAERLAKVGDEFAVPRRTTSFDEVLAMEISTSSTSARRRPCISRKPSRRSPPASM